MTNKLLIVKYILFNIDVDIDIDIDENNAFSRNLSTNLDRRDDFDDANFDIIVAQNICVFDVANKIRSTKLNISIDDVIDEVKKV